MISAVEVSLKPHLPDPRGEGVARGIKDLGILKDITVRTHDLYWLEGDIDPNELERIAAYLLTDPIVQQYCLNPGYEPDTDTSHSLTVTYNPGVADPVEGTVMKALDDMGATSVKAVKTAARYVLEGSLTPDEIQTIAARLLVNPIIQHTVKEAPTAFAASPRYEFELRRLDLLAADEAQLIKIGRDYYFSPAEIKAVAGYYRKLGRNPTDAELETLAQTWSEHCVHKTFKACFSFNGRQIDNLLKNHHRQSHPAAKQALVPFGV
jgi:phosphoribosylformylglycinamidine synthase